LFQIQFVASRDFRDRVLEAQDLLRHRVPDGDLGTILGKALELLIEQVKKERFGIGRKARKGIMDSKTTPEGLACSRHIPAAIRRAVWERDGGRCTITDEQGRRCEATDVVFDHVEGFARTHAHTVAGLRLVCRAHNQFLAEQMYGRAFMEKARGRATSCAAMEISGPGSGRDPGPSVAERPDPAATRAGTSSLPSAGVEPSPGAGL